MCDRCEKVPGEATFGEEGRCVGCEVFAACDVLLVLTLASGDVEFYSGEVEFVADIVCTVGLVYRQLR